MFGKTTLHFIVEFFARLSFSTLIVILEPLLEIPRHILSQLLNLRLRQSEDAADADPMNNAMPDIKASIVNKNLFMFIGERI